MTIFLKDIVDEEFILLIPQFIIKRVREKLNKNKYQAMQEYLQENYDVSIDDIITQLAIKGFSYSKVKDLLIVRIDDNIKEEKSQEKLSMFVRLINYGNLQIRGTHLIEDTINYIKSNILNIYRFYQMRKGR